MRVRKGSDRSPLVYPSPASKRRQAARQAEKANPLIFSNSTFFSVARLTTATLFCSGLRSFFSLFPSLKVGEIVKASHFESSENATSRGTGPAGTGPPPKPCDSPTGNFHSFPSLIRRNTNSLSPSLGVSLQANHCPSLETIGEAIRFQARLSAISIGRGAFAASCADWHEALYGMGEASVSANSKTTKTTRFFFVILAS